MFLCMGSSWVLVRMCIYVYVFICASTHVHAHACVSSGLYMIVCVCVCVLLDAVFPFVYNLQIPVFFGRTHSRVLQMALV